MITFLERLRESHYWNGFALGALTTALAFLAVDKLSFTPKHYVAGAIPTDIVQSYNLGLKDALRVNPPSFELEQACLNMWADRQPVSEP